MTMLDKAGLGVFADVGDARRTKAERAERARNVTGAERDRRASGNGVMKFRFRV